MIMGYVICGLLQLALLAKFIPVYMSDEGKRLREEEARLRAIRKEERKNELKL